MTNVLPYPAPPLTDAAHRAAAPAGMSSGECSAAFARPVNPHKLRCLFPDRWAGFLRAHFRDPVEVAFTFDVDEKTARNWWHGVTAPRGAAVAQAFAMQPAAAQAMLARAA